MVLLLSNGVLFGQPAQSLEGKTIDLSQEAAGRPFVLVFIRSDCPISNRYSPVLQALHRQYQGRVAFWLVYADSDETQASIEEHLRRYAFGIPAVRDPKQTLVKLSEARVTPEAAVFSANGKLMYHGRIDNWYESFGHARPTPTTHELRDALEAVLAGRLPNVTATRAVGCYLADLR
jgi:thiol-disulfide isomerase/thioredoxin